MTDDQLDPDLESDLRRLRELYDQLNLPETFESPVPADQRVGAADFIARMKAQDAAAEATDTAAEPRPTPIERGNRRRRWATVAAAAAAAAVGLTIVLQPGHSPRAAADGPPILDFEFANAKTIATAEGRDAGEALRRLAVVALRQPDITKDGATQYVGTDNWYGEFDGSESAKGAIVPTIRQTWLQPDGSFTLAEFKGRALSPDGRGVPKKVNPSSGRIVEAYGPDTNDPDFIDDLAPTPEGVRTGLTERVGCSTTPGPARTDCLFREVLSVANTYVVPPAIESAMWEMLADEEGIRFLGTVKDRAGRAGQGFAVIDPERAHIRNVLIISDNGHLIGHEDILINRVDELDVQAPAILSFTAFLDATYTDEQPPPATNGSDPS